MDDEKQPHYQIFKGPVENVAGRDINPPSERPPLRKQRWGAKHYIFGRSITSGWLLTITALVFLGTILGSSASRGFSMSFYAFIVSGVLLIGAGTVAMTGVIGIPRTLYGIARDLNGYIFLGKLDDEKSFCSVCNAKLVFLYSGSGGLST